MTPEEIIKKLELKPHPAEGGYFRETYRSPNSLPSSALPNYPGERAASTAIYYLLTPATSSRLHRLRGDEIFHFYYGDPTKMLQLSPDGGVREIVLGSDLAAGQRVQVLVPAGHWQGCRLVDGGSVALLGCTVAPGFEYEDFEAGSRLELTRHYPSVAEEILRLTLPDV